MIGALAFIAMSCSFVIFSAWVSDSEPPNTVKSLANTKVLRPLTVPQPVTTPSPGILFFSMPNSVERCSTNMSNSSNEPLSSRSSMRSRAVNLPRACCASMRFLPPPSFAPARRSSRVSRMSFICSRAPAIFGLISRGSSTTFSEPETWLAGPGATRLAVRGIKDSQRSFTDERDDHHGRHGRRDRRGENPAAAGRADAVCRDDAALRGLGRIVVDLRHPVPGARSELCRLSCRPQDRRHHLQRRPQLHGAGGADDGGICARLPAVAFRRDDLDGAYRHRSRIRLWLEILGRIRLHPSRPGRANDDAAEPLERFPAKWIPVRVKKTR